MDDLQQIVNEPQAGQTGTKERQNDFQMILTSKKSLP
jgi:hypothetical protein